MSCLYVTSLATPLLSKWHVARMHQAALDKDRRAILLMTQMVFGLGLREPDFATSRQEVKRPGGKGSYMLHFVKPCAMPDGA